MNETTLSIITIAATGITAILAPVLSAFINARAQYRLKVLELFFNEKAEAYKNFLIVSSNYMKDPSNENAVSLNVATNKAILFSTSHTQEKIALYAQHLITDNKNFPDSNTDVLLAMYADLRHFKER